MLINFTRIERPTPLRHGDLLSFGTHYIFLYRDPLSAKPLPGHTLTHLRALGAKNGEACPTCGAAPREQAGFRQSSKNAKGPKKRKLVLEFERAQEDALVNRVLTLIEPSSDDHKLTPAYLLCLCIQHSALSFPPGSFGKLLLKIAKKIQSIARVGLRHCVVLSNFDLTLTLTLTLDLTQTLTLYLTEYYAMVCYNAPSDQNWTFFTQNITIW